ncbi:hypothetical protein M501DRAFT_1015948 [Patellaria atrata CBS 101060]|uniref:Uncharacterized protein n=1 Tax=Patellaria atrata CBS 101060 TaxID=1346257 RepID=A0A9P4VNL0_9PEZI|nr:hypothetical protein M501DRAFT_1015948 [Patellaria atrata CBS 101060]
MHSTLALATVSALLMGSTVSAAPSRRAAFRRQAPVDGAPVAINLSNDLTGANAPNDNVNNTPLTVNGGPVLINDGWANTGFELTQNNNFQGCFASFNTGGIDGVTCAITNSAGILVGLLSNGQSADLDNVAGQCIPVDLSGAAAYAECWSTSYTRTKRQDSDIVSINLSNDILGLNDVADIPIDGDKRVLPAVLRGANVSPILVNGLAVASSGALNAGVADCYFQDINENVFKYDGNVGFVDLDGDHTQAIPNTLDNVQCFPVGEGSYRN